MPEVNGSSDHEARLRRLEEARKELEDAFVVMTHLETKQSNVIKELAAEQEAQRKRTTELDEAQRKRTAELDERINKIISAFGDLIARIPPPNLR